MPAAGRHQGQGDRGCCSPHRAVCGGRGWEFITCFININVYDTLSVPVSVSYRAVCGGRGWEFITCFIWIYVYILCQFLSLSLPVCCCERNQTSGTEYCWVGSNSSICLHQFLSPSLSVCHYTQKGTKLQGQSTAGWVVFHQLLSPSLSVCHHETETVKGTKLQAKSTAGWIVQFFSSVPAAVQTTWNLEYCWWTTLLLCLHSAFHFKLS